MFAQRPKKKVVEQLKEYLRKHPQLTAPKPLNVPNVLRTAPQQGAAPMPKADFSNVTPRYYTTDMSLKEMMNQITEEQKKGLMSKQANGTQNKPLDEERVRELWQRFLRSLDQSNMHLSAAMVNTPKVENDAIVVEVATKMLGDVLATNADLVNFLRYETGHLGLVIKPVVQSNSQSKPQEMVYTARQKFEKMREQNVHIGELAEMFKLCIEY